jgi:hypothetical protein
MSRRDWTMAPRVASGFHTLSMDSLDVNEYMND